MAPNSLFCLRSGRPFPTSPVFCSETVNSTSCEWPVRSPLLIFLTFYNRVVIVTNPFIVACVYVFKPPVSIMFLVCHLLLVNILSNRVYRNIKTGLVPDVAMPPVLSRPSEPLVLADHCVLLQSCRHNILDLCLVSRYPSIVSHLRFLGSNRSRCFAYLACVISGAGQPRGNRAPTPAESSESRVDGHRRWSCASTGHCV